MNEGIFAILTHEEVKEWLILIAANANEAAERCAEKLQTSTSDTAGINAYIKGDILREKAALFEFVALHLPDGDFKLTAEDLKKWEFV